MAVSVQAASPVWESVLEQTKSAQDKNRDPLLWAVQLSSSLNSAGISLPSIDLAHLLVSHICWDNHVPITWKFLEKALTVKFVPSVLVLALLSTRVIPNRKFHPAAYRLYMELLRRHAFSLKCQINGPNYQKIMKSVGDVLHLSQIFGVQVSEPGLLLVEFVFSIVWQLLDASLDDEGLLELTSEKRSIWPTVTQDMEIDSVDNFNEKRSEHHDVLCKGNTTMAIEIIGEFLQNKVTARILFLARRNMPSHWGTFIQQLRVLAVKSVALRNAKHITPVALLNLTSDMHKVVSRKCKTISQQEFNAVIGSGSLTTSSGQCHGTGPSAHWLPIDLFLEDAMDGSQVAATGAVESLTGLVKALQAVNGTTWHDTFLGLWIAALRLVQRVEKLLHLWLPTFERDISEGPVPRLDTCLCMLLSITPLVVANIVEEEESELIDGSDCSPTNQIKEKQAPGICRQDLISSLQMLGDYEALLTPPQPVRSVANQAAAKAIMFVSGLTVGNGYYECMSINDMPINCSGNMRHLIVEACIARNLLDTSAYVWPGYVNARANIPRNVPVQVTGWSSLMKGSPLTPTLINALIATPASRYAANNFFLFFSHGFDGSLAEIEKIYEIATKGSDDEKISAASILCGASLVRGWNIQEHTILFITSLLSPPVPADYSGSESHLISYGPFFNILLVGISPVDCVQIFSLHGLVPLLAGTLMPLCEVFGSTSPNVSWTLPTGEELTSHAVFSNAFTLLLRLWRFNHPPFENAMGDATPVGSQLTPEYLLLVRNSKLSDFGKSPKDHMKLKRMSKNVNISLELLFMDSFPKLKSWYRQHQECIASTLSGLVQGTTVHQIVDALLNMMFRKISRGGQSLTSTTSGSSSSPASGAEDVSMRLKVPAWDILEGAPYVLDASLTACAHGRLLPRDLATGLKDLADLLPATLATIVSYLSAEVTRGIWKPVFMNGTDWPSPSANLFMVEQQIKKIIAATGVDVPSLAIGGSSPAMLPLPLAALVSLTITYKLDKASERFIVLIGPALSSLAESCPWPCMPIIASLWAQKVKRWSDFLVFSASRTVFHHNIDAVVQLLRSCFTSIPGLSPSTIYSNGGVGALLGHGFGSHFSGGMSAVAPGILYLRVHRSVRNIMFMTEEIVSLLMSSVRDIANSGLFGENLEKLKKAKFGLRYRQVSLGAATTRVRLAASLGASLVWLSGGLSLVQLLIQETLPSWFLSAHTPDQDGGEPGGLVAMLSGYALAYFVVLCGTLAWGVDSSSPTSKRRSKVLGAHLEFLASAIDGKISLGCEYATWHAYVTGFVSLMVGCTKKWVLDVNVDVLRRLSNGLRQWNEEELAIALLGLGGAEATASAAELIIEIGP
ncbi:mediator of RNA polymerase II transcription subunit 33B-like isoform X1 [Gossypium australe]|uniref:Mediator of RNA polymerase II transcription subunit 33B-like isoform X1 n=2 Tax=Gossypium australe TaxID=47621 RepID=A0A5B6VZX0_9ROSI|nr:mediator of RNA polymerase II transcription subunit 33B-like isoform X1 [Gossypium australe]